MLRGKLWGALSVGCYSSKLIKEVQQGLQSLSHETLLLLNTALRGRYRDSATLRAWLHQHSPTSNLSPNESFLRELIVFSQSFRAGTDSDYVYLAISSLRDYGRLPRLDDYSLADQDTKKIIGILLSISDHLYSDWADDDLDSVPMSIHVPELIDVIFENPDQDEYIRELVIKRGTTDAAMIREVLQGASAALYEGAL